MVIGIPELSNPFPQNLQATNICSELQVKQRSPYRISPNPHSRQLVLNIKYAPFEQTGYFIHIPEGGLALFPTNSRVEPAPVYDLQIAPIECASGAEFRGFNYFLENPGEAELSLDYSTLVVGRVSLNKLHPPIPELNLKIFSPGFEYGIDS